MIIGTPWTREACVRLAGSRAFKLLKACASQLTGTDETTPGGGPERAPTSGATTRKTTEAYRQTRSLDSGAHPGHRRGWSAGTRADRGAGVTRSPWSGPPRSRHHRSAGRSEEHTSELQSRQYLVCRLLLEKKKKKNNTQTSKNHSGTRKRNH